MKEDASCLSLETTRREWVRTFLPYPFRNLDLSTYPHPTDQHRVALQAAQQYVSDIRSGCRQPLFLFGLQGSGKTMLASCVWNELAASVPDRAFYADAQQAGTADNIAFTSGSELVSWLRPDSQDATGNPARRRQHIETCFLAVIDDIDKFPNGEWGNALFQIIDSRLWRLRVPTIVTSNLSPPAFARRYGEAGASMADRFVRAGGVFVRLDEKPVTPAQDVSVPAAGTGKPEGGADVGHTPADAAQA